jgi:hypothetical protein
MSVRPVFIVFSSILFGETDIVKVLGGELHPFGFLSSEAPAECAITASLGSPVLKEMIALGECCIEVE